jgi:integrase
MPDIQSGTVPPPFVSYKEKRPREYLVPHEVEELISVAKKRGRYGHRDATMILLAYRHGLRVSELCAVRWEQIDFDARISTFIVFVCHGARKSHNGCWFS